MYELPKEPSLIRERIRRYQRKLRVEKARWGMIRDGAGKRYLLGPLFLLLGDLDNALDCFRWFEAEFPDDCGEPGHHLCWTLALYRGGDHEAAARKLRQTMLMNLYLIPHLLGVCRRNTIWGRHIFDGHYNVCHENLETLQS